jgi:ABC-type multidrug transport system permease subunit
MSKIGALVIVLSAAIGSTYYSTFGAAVLGMLAKVFVFMAVVAGLLVSLSVVFCMFCLPLINLTRFVCGRFVLLSKRS